jgi:hypothetical protein
MTDSGKPSKRANQLLAAVGSLSVSLGMTIWTEPVDGAIAATTEHGSEQVKHNAVKIESIYTKHSKYSADVMSSHKGQAGTGGQNSIKFWDQNQNSVKTGNQNMSKWNLHQNSLKPGVQNSVKAKNWGGSAGGDNPQE